MNIGCSLNAVSECRLNAVLETSLSNSSAHACKKTILKVGIIHVILGIIMMDRWYGSVEKELSPESPRIWVWSLEPSYEKK